MLTSSEPDSWIMEYGYNDSKNKLGFIVGGDLQYQFTKVFGVTVGIDYAELGCKYDTQLDKRNKYIKDHYDNMSTMLEDDFPVKFRAGDITTKYNVVGVSLLANAYIWKGLAVKTGVEPQFLVYNKTRCKVEYLVPVQANASREDRYAVGAAAQTIDFKELNFTIPVGISYEYKNFVTDARYNFGVTNVVGYYNGKNKPNVKSRAFSLTIGYKL